MNIGQAAKESGVNPKMIRHYEGLDIISPSRTPNKYRVYGEDDVRRLRFAHAAREIGMPLADVKRALELMDGPRLFASQTELAAMIGGMSKKMRALQFVHTLMVSVLAKSDPA